jgi:rfaE bifunctional protein nucleotidyltransferase chain/domain
MDRGDRAAPVGFATPAARTALSWADAVLVADYGRGVAADEGLRETIAELCSLMPVVWDPHPHGPPPVPGVTVATPNESELERAVAHGDAGLKTTEIAEGAQLLHRKWSTHALCVTRGREGALLVTPERAPVAIPAEPVRYGDPCGAGDRFSSRLTSSLAQGTQLQDAVCEAVAAASIFVAAGGARAFADNSPGDAHTSLQHATSDAFELARDVRAAGGVVVATGGCFDLLHAGHVSTLMAARRLGDCLIVCINSDRSVGRLKGAGRPVVAENDRVALLRALGCVDAVVVFDEDTPETVLRELHPHVWAKGGDYSSETMPEARAVQDGGGQVIVLPFVEGHSTTRLIEEASTKR